ncbi:universal stress protein [Halarsenatibacter silvermanii]|uniref:Universal stress protein n=1 Tax=Halarsenatibacter silvermanii TaxID=321763 RepID=A0A1G9R881_9FIRM|nr:universal stress protein [Halarsenatibacter silvermanii]SDM18635.1 Nucleotide-binding universal stress protein, UspA family [Halarsenatibacter silvermanii]
MEKILLAYDGSETCDKAVGKVSELAQDLNASVTVITVVESATSAPSLQNGYSSQREEKAREMAEKCAERIGIENVNIIAKEGNPAHLICNEAEKGDFDLVVMGERGKSRIKRFLIGSTTEKVVRQSKKSVMVVK